MLWLNTSFVSPRLLFVFSTVSSRQSIFYIKHLESNYGLWGEMSMLEFNSPTLHGGWGWGLIIIKCWWKKENIVEKTRWGSFLLGDPSMLTSPLGKIQPLENPTFCSHNLWISLQVFKCLWIKGVLKQGDI